MGAGGRLGQRESACNVYPTLHPVSLRLGVDLHRHGALSCAVVCWQTLIYRTARGIGVYGSDHFYGFAKVSTRISIGSALIAGRSFSIARDASICS